MNPTTQILINEISGRIASTLRGEYGSRDSKHTQAWSDYGYKDKLEFNDHYQMYRRFGIAKAGIRIPVTHCWKTKPKIYQGAEGEQEERTEETPWESSLASIFKRKAIWRKLKLSDEYQRVGQYGAMVIQVRGKGTEPMWDKPLGKIRENQIVKFIPLFETQLDPVSWDMDETSERYGQPETYQFQESNLLDDTRQDQRQRSVTVHWSRVIIFAEGADDDSIYGVPANEGGFNDLVTMEKIIGAGGEGFWKSAAMKTVFTDTNKDASTLSEEDADEVDQAIQDFFNGLDKHLMTGSLDPKVLSVALADPKEHFAIALQSYSASVEIAAKILVGAQEGRLAADEDGRFTLSNFQSRREDWCTSMVSGVVDWLINHGVIENVEYHVEWDDLLAPSDKDKFELGERLTKVITELYKTTGESPIDPSEVAKIMGYQAQEESPDDITEELDDDVFPDEE